MTTLQTWRVTLLYHTVDFGLFLRHHESMIHLYARKVIQMFFNKSHCGFWSMFLSASSAALLALTFFFIHFFQNLFILIMLPDFSILILTFLIHLVILISFNYTFQSYFQFFINFSQLCHNSVFARAYRLEVFSVLFFLLLIFSTNQIENRGVM